MINRWRQFPKRDWFQSHAYQVLDVLISISWVGFSLYLIFGFWGKTYDDVFLAFQYAKHIEMGLGFVFNPGEHFLGTPAPLYVLMLAGVHQLLPWLTLPQVGSILSGVGLSISGWIAYLIGRQWNQRWVGLICGLLIISSPFTIMTLGGETPLYLALTMTAIYLYCLGHYGTSALLLALAMVNRSEAIIPILILLILYVIEKRRFPIRMVVAFTIVLGPWLIYSFIAFGGPVSNSFIAKIAQVAAGLPRYPFGFRSWTTNIVRQSGYLLYAVVPLAGIGLLSIPYVIKPWRIIIAWAVAQTIAYVVLPIPFYHWYAAQIGVLLAVLVSIGSIQFIQWSVNPTSVLRSSMKRVMEKMGGFSPVIRVSSLGLIGISSILAIMVVFAQYRFTSWYQATMPNPSNRIYTKTGLWLAENTPVDARIAYIEIGQIAFYSNRYMVDLLGLVSPGISSHVGKNDWLWAFSKYKPDYIVYNELFSNWLKPLYSQNWFTQGFEEVALIEEKGYPYPLHIYHIKPGIVIPNLIVSNPNLTVK